MNPNCIIVTQPQPTPPRDAATSISLLNETRVSESQGNYDVWLKAFKNKQTIIQKQKWHARMPLLLRLHFFPIFTITLHNHMTLILNIVLIITALKNRFLRHDSLRKTANISRKIFNIFRKIGVHKLAKNPKWAFARKLDTVTCENITIAMAS